MQKKFSIFPLIDWIFSRFFPATDWRIWRCFLKISWRYFTNFSHDQLKEFTILSEHPLINFVIHLLLQRSTNFAIFFYHRLKNFTIFARNWWRIHLYFLVTDRRSSRIFPAADCRILRFYLRLTDEFRFFSEIDRIISLSFRETNKQILW